MKLISHRGNISGPNVERENSPEYIDEAISLGFDVEIDVRYSKCEEKFYLGHDDPQYHVTRYWLAERMENFWIHCKNIEALFEFVNTGGYNYFWHQEDDFTLTSKNYIWTYPGKTYTPRSVIVMPETSIDIDKLSDLKVYNCFAICSDYIGRIK
jgi:hypothetical protein